MMTVTLLLTKHPKFTNDSRLLDSCECCGLWAVDCHPNHSGLTFFPSGTPERRRILHTTAKARYQGISKEGVGRYCSHHHNS
ncbi:hypothetical protein L6452_04871 [Arctium lappa]|uniref:Uncharacterized protein n=1 Tax=Arctium lappa TaxID=4217 RepID=A0ACB9EEQ6_ARCLA|nr:hypothetical protein L6452_04871 [Arctium lappa]